MGLKKLLTTEMPTISKSTPYWRALKVCSLLFLLPEVILAVALLFNQVTLTDAWQISLGLLVLWPMMPLILRMKERTLFGVITAAVTILLIAFVVLFMPTEKVNSRSTQYADRRLLSDLSISNQIDFVAGRFRRESVIIYRLLSSDFSTSKFSIVRMEELKRDYVKRVSAVARSCNVDFTPLMDDDVLVYYGSDYSVVYVKSKPSSYIIYFGAQ